MYPQATLGDLADNVLGLSVSPGSHAFKSLARIVEEVRLEPDRCREEYILSPSVACAVLSILQVPGLVRMTWHAFVITEVGIEVHRRIEAHSATSAISHAGRTNARILRNASAALVD